jgi:LysM repeat protein
MRQFLMLVIVFLLSLSSLTAQEQFIEHTIVKGETVYIISQKYGVTIDAIFELNPSAADIIYPGEILRIPYLNNTSALQGNSNNNDTNLIDYQVKRGETKFGLSKKFGVSITMLEQQNPHIVSMLQAGHVIKVDRTIETNPKVASNKNEHIVLKGETLWGISKQYKTSLNSLISANSNQLSEFLQIGQTLIIPNEGNIDSTLNTEEYIVKRGETKYSLAKRFEMSVPELEEKNPHIVPMLMAGHRLSVTNVTQVLANNVNVQPETKITEEDKQEETVTVIETKSEDNSVETEERLVDYVIQPKETLYSLSKKSGLTIDELTALNPNLLRAVNDGDVIKMPSTTKQIVKDPFNIVSDSLNSIAVPNKNSVLLSNLDLNQKNGIYFYLPFSNEEFNARKIQITSPDKDEQQYYDFYQGAQIAIDSARALNLKFDVTVFRKNKIPNSKIIVDDTNNENVVIIPFLDKNESSPEIISTKNSSIIDVQSNIVAAPNTTIYEPIPSGRFQKTKTLNYLASKNANVIVISELEEAKNRDLILKTIPDTKFLKVDNAGFFNDSELEKTLNKDQLNYVILDSEQTIVFLNTTTTLMGKLSDYDIQLVLIDPNLIPKQNEVSDMRYRILKLIYPTIALMEDLKDLNDFENKYARIHQTKPTMNAVIGFDITFDILLRVSQNSSFENSINTILKSDHLQIEFNYQKTNSLNYYNVGVHLMQYNSTDGVVRID